MYIEPHNKEMMLGVYDVAEKAGYVVDQLVRSFEYSIDDAYQLIINSGYDELWFDDDPRKFSSRFPDEIVQKIVSFEGKDHSDEDPNFRYYEGMEFWTGWFLTCLMWETSWKLPYILSAIPATEIENMFFPYHELDVGRAINEMIARVRNYYEHEHSNQ